MRLVVDKLNREALMIDFATLGTFIAVVLGLFLIPGPAVLLTLTRTVQGGRWVGTCTGLGIATGDFIHALCTAVGLSALLMTSSLAFTVVKLGGAAYLIYLGVRALSANTTKTPAPAEATVATATNARRLTPARAFLQAIPAEVLNPKTALFFLAFLPQFTHPDHGSTFVQFITLGLVFAAMSALYTVSLALAVRPLGRLTRRLRWLVRWQGKLVGTIFIGLGLKVALLHR